MSRPGFEIIRGAHIDLVEVDPVHFEQIVRWRSDPEIGQQFFFSGPYTLKGQRKWYERYRLDEKDLTFVATLKTGFPVGMAALYDIDEEKAVAQFGRLLVGERAYRGQGIALEASQLCLDLGFRDLGLQEIYLEVFASNIPAVRLYERLGFVAGVSWEHVGKEGGRKPVQRMTIKKRTAWQNV